MTPHEDQVEPPRPPFWVRMSVRQGNVWQLAGIGLGCLLLGIAPQLSGQGGLQVALMLLGWLAMYICSHAIAHYAVGRIVGIRFVGYGLRGSDHPYDYPAIPGLRATMARFPTFTAITDKESMKAARPLAKALMFAAGETSTTLTSLLAAVWAWGQGLPGGGLFFVVMLVFSAAVTWVTTVTPRGDYAKALKALRHK